MANILPPDIQKKINAQRRARFIIIGSIVSLISSGVVIGALLPSYVVLHAYQLAPVTATAQPSGRSHDETTVLLRTQSMLDDLTPLIATSTPTEAIRAALALKPRGIHIDHINYQAGRLLIQGAADDSADVSSYRTALAADKHFSQATVPVGALLGSVNGRFDITLLGSF